MKKKNLIFRIACIISIFLMILTIGILSQKIIENNKLKTRTIMIYMVGSNLESDSGLATVDLNSIKYNSMDNKNVKVVLLAGGTEKWSNNYISKDETSIYELKSDGFVKVKQQELQNMGESKILTDFINYTYDHYKSDKYDLIFWNHGGAIDGSEYDDLSNDNLSLKEIKDGLDNSVFNGKKKLETIMFRTCLNGTLEMSSMISNNAEYLVASEEITIGTRFTSVLDFINNIKMEDDGYSLGLKFIDSYKKQITEYKQIYNFSYGDEAPLYSTYSIVKLSNIDNLNKALNNFVKDIDVASNYNTIAKVRSNLYQYAYTQADEAAYDMIDLYNLVDKLKDLSPKKAKKLQEEFNQTVLYNWATNSESRGISIYFPYNAPQIVKQEFLSTYDDFSNLKEYKEFITKFNEIQGSSKRNYSFTENKQTISTKNDTSDFEIELTDEQLEGFAKADYLVFESLDEEGYYRPIYKGKNFKLEGNKLSASIKGKLVKMTDIEDPSSDYVIYLSEIDENDNYAKYWSVGVLENIPSASDPDFFNKYNIQTVEYNFIRDKKTDEIKISSILKVEDDTEQKKPNSVAVDINDYTHIVFGSEGWQLVDENNNYIEDFDNNGIFQGMEVKISDVKFKLEDFSEQKNYYCVFRIYDVDNNYYYSKVVKMK